MCQHMGFVMDWPNLITAVGGVLITFGGGVKYLIARSDSKTAAVQSVLQDRIDTLKQMLDKNSAAIERYRTENLALVRHVGMLEGIMGAKGIEVPPMPVASAQTTDTETPNNGSV